MREVHDAFAKPAIRGWTSGAGSPLSAQVLGRQPNALRRLAAGLSRYCPSGRFAKASLPANRATRQQPEPKTARAASSRHTRQKCRATSCPSSWSISSPSSRSSSWLPFAGSSVWASVRPSVASSRTPYTGRWLVESSTRERRDRATHRAAHLDQLTSMVAFDQVDPGFVKAKWPAEKRF